LIIFIHKDLIVIKNIWFLKIKLLNEFTDNRS